MIRWKRMVLYIGLWFGLPLAIFLIILLVKPQNVYVWPFPLSFSTTDIDMFLLLILLPFILFTIILLFLSPKGLPVFIHTSQKVEKSERCPQCGTYLTGWENYCPKCGFNLKEREENQFS